MRYIRLEYGTKEQDYVEKCKNRERSIQNKLELRGQLGIKTIKDKITHE